MNPENIADKIRAQLPGSSVDKATGEAVEFPPPSIPNHRLLHKIGSGSYGEVWLARGVTGALRAVKVVWRNCFASDRPYEREFEGIVAFEPISRSHPGVISILHVGRDEEAECFFYVMELADDAEGDITTTFHTPRTLRHDLKTRGRLPVMDVLTLGVQLADALGHLHRHGLVHRDVKPSNVVYVDGHPKLADIGLVTNRDESLSFVGTEGFIPPEGQGSVRADIFSLGRLLYEAVTGLDRCDFPALPDDLDRWPQEQREMLLELNEILTRMCAPDASRRHENAAIVAGDLNIVLAGKSVRRAYQVELRHNRAKRFSAAAVGVLALVSVVLWYKNAEQKKAEQLAASERSLRQRVEVAEHEASQQLYAALREQARGNRRNRILGQRVVTLDALRRAAAIRNMPELRTEAFAALALPDMRLLREIAFDQDEHGRIFDSAFERFAVCRERGPVEIRSAVEGDLIATLPGASDLKAFLMLWSPDGKYLAVKRDHDAAGIVGDLEVWDTRSIGRVLMVREALGHDALSFHPTEPRIMAGTPRKTVEIWDLETGRRLQEFAVAGGTPFSLRYSPDGGRFGMVVLADSQISRAEVRDSKDGAIQYADSEGAAFRIEWHPTGRMLAIPDAMGDIRLLDFQSKTTRVLGQHKAQAVMAAFHPDGRYLITGGWEAELICWDLLTMERAFTIGLNSWRLQFRKGGGQCAVEVGDRVQMHEFIAPDCVRDLAHEPGKGILFGAFSQDGRWLAANQDGGILVWDLENPSPAAWLNEADVSVPLFAADPSGTELLAYTENALQRWRLSPAGASRPPLAESLPAFSPSEFCSISVRADQLIFTGFNGIQFTPRDNPAPETARQVDTAGGWSVVSPDGKLLAARMAGESEVRVFHLPGLQRAASLTCRASVWTMTFSPSSAELAIGTRSGLEFYDATNWQRTRELTISSERSSRVIYEPDGNTLWHTSDGRTAALRDTRTLEALLPLPPYSLPLALSADGRQLAISVDTRQVQVWDLSAVRRQFRKMGMDWSMNDDSGKTRAR